MTLEFRAVHAPPLRGMSLSLGPGVYCLLADTKHGAPELVELIAGVRAPSRGRVLLGGKPPHSDPLIRRRVGSVLAFERLPPAATVLASVQAAIHYRSGSDDAQQVLGGVGLSSWADRPLSSLEPGERRAVALALALSIEEPGWLALFEPIAALGPVADASDRLRETLHSRAASGTVVVVATASARVAFALGGQVAKLERGQVSWVSEPSVTTLGAEGEFLVWSKEAPRLAGLLASSSAVVAVEFDQERFQDQLRVRSRSGRDGALEIARVARESGIEIGAMWPRLASLETLSAQSAGRARAAYDAAYHQAWAARQAQSAPPVAAPPAPQPVASTPPVASPAAASVPPSAPPTPGEGSR